MNADLTARRVDWIIGHADSSHRDSIDDDEVIELFMDLQTSTEDDSDDTDIELRGLVNVATLIETARPVMIVCLPITSQKIRSTTIHTFGDDSGCRIDGIERCFQIASNSILDVTCSSV